MIRAPRAATSVAVAASTWYQRTQGSLAQFPTALSVTSVRGGATDGAVSVTEGAGAKCSRSGATTPAPATVRFARPRSVRTAGKVAPSKRNTMPAFQTVERDASLRAGFRKANPMRAMPIAAQAIVNVMRKVS